MRPLQLLAALSVACACSACASLVSRPDQTIEVTSDPPGATVRIRDQVVETPATVTLSRKENYTVRVCKDGYYDGYGKLRCVENPWILGNLLWDLPTTGALMFVTQGMGGLIVFGPGSLYDRYTGAGYQLVPNKIAVRLEQRLADGDAEESSVPATPPAPRIVKDILIHGPVGSIRAGAGSVWVVHGDDTVLWRPNRLSRIDPATNEVAETLDNPAGLAPLFVEQDALWFLRHELFRTPVLCKMDLQTRTVTATLSVPPLAQLAVGADGVYLLYWNRDAKQLEVLRVDPQTVQVSAHIPLPESMWPALKRGEHSGNAPILATGLGSVWVARGKSVARIDPQTKQVVTVVPLDHGIHQLVVGEGAVWAFGGNSPYDREPMSRVTRIDAGTNQASRPILYGGHPLEQAVGAGAVWIINGEDRTLQWIDARTGHPTEKPLPLPKTVRWTGCPGPMIAVRGDAIWLMTEDSVLRIAPE